MQYETEDQGTLILARAFSFHFMQLLLTQELAKSNLLEVLRQHRVSLLFELVHPPRAGLACNFDKTLRLLRVASIRMLPCVCKLDPTQCTRIQAKK